MAVALATPLRARRSRRRRPQFFLFGDPERGTAAAGRDHVRVVDLEAGALETVDEVDHRALDVGQARAVDQQADALVLEDGVAVALLVERECILEAGAAATAHPDPESGGVGRAALGGEELADLLGALSVRVIMLQEV